MDNATALASFVAITGADTEIAKQFLEVKNFS